MVLTWTEYEQNPSIAISRTLHASAFIEEHIGPLPSRPLCTYPSLTASSARSRFAALEDQDRPTGDSCGCSTRSTRRDFLGFFVRVPARPRARTDALQRTVLSRLSAKKVKLDTGPPDIPDRSFDEISPGMVDFASWNIGSADRRNHPADPEMAQGLAGLWKTEIVSASWTRGTRTGVGDLTAHWPTSICTTFSRSLGRPRWATGARGQRRT